MQFNFKGILNYYRQYREVKLVVNARLFDFFQSKHTRISVICFIIKKNCHYCSVVVMFGWYVGISIIDAKILESSLFATIADDVDAACLDCLLDCICCSFGGGGIAGSVATSCWWCFWRLRRPLAWKARQKR